MPHTHYHHYPHATHCLCCLLCKMPAHDMPCIHAMLFSFICHCYAMLRVSEVTRGSSELEPSQGSYYAMRLLLFFSSIFQWVIFICCYWCYWLPELLIYYEATCHAMPDAFSLWAMPWLLIDMPLITACSAMPWLMHYYGIFPAIL